MVDFVPLLLAGLVIVLWGLGLVFLQRRGLLEPRGLSLSPPPFLMWKTVKGRQVIDRIGGRGDANGVAPERGRDRIR